MWDLVPWLGIEPGPLAMGVWSLSHWIAREVPTIDTLSTHVEIGNFLAAVLPSSFVWQAYFSFNVTSRQKKLRVTLLLQLPLPQKLMATLVFHFYHFHFVLKLKCFFLANLGIHLILSLYLIQWFFFFFCFAELFKLSNPSYHQDLKSLRRFFSIFVRMGADTFKISIIVSSVNLQLYFISTLKC